MVEFSRGVIPLPQASEKPQHSPSFSAGGCWVRVKPSMLYGMLLCAWWRWLSVLQVIRISTPLSPRLWQPPASVLQAVKLSCSLKSCLWCALAVGLLGCSCPATFVQETFHCQTVLWAVGDQFSLDFLGVMFLFLPLIYCVIHCK